MSQYFELHPQNPQLRLIRQAVGILRNGGLIAYPTDSCYALGCHIGDAAALERIRTLRAADRHHHFTLVCANLAEIARFARVETWQFRLLKAATPGPFTFLLPATRETPRRLQHAQRRTRNDFDGSPQVFDQLSFVGRSKVSLSGVCVQQKLAAEDLWSLCRPQEVP